MLATPSARRQRTARWLAQSAAGGAKMQAHSIQTLGNGPSNMSELSAFVGVGRMGQGQSQEEEHQGTHEGGNVAVPSRLS